MKDKREVTSSNMNRHPQKSTNTFSDMKAYHPPTRSPSYPSSYGTNLYHTQHNDSGQYYGHHGGQYYAGLPRNSKKSPLQNEYVNESHCCCTCYHDLAGISKLQRANQGDQYLQNPGSHMSFIIPPDSSAPNYAELDDCKRYALMVAFWFVVLAFAGIFKYFEAPSTEAYVEVPDVRACSMLTLLCFVGFGLFSFVKYFQSESKKKAGRFGEALKAARLARDSALVALGCGIGLSISAIAVLHSS